MRTINKPEHGSLEWLMVRHRDENGLVTFGASEAGALMGVSEYDTRYDLAVNKLNDPILKPPQAAMIKGIIFEAALGQYAESVLGIGLHTPDVMYRRGRFTATLDFLNEEAGLIVEAKVTSAYAVDSHIDLPASWVMQGHVQHYCTGHAIKFVVFDKRQKLVVVDMPIDVALVDRLVEEAELFGAELDAGVMPTFEREVSTAPAIELPDEVAAWVRELEDCRALKKQGEDGEKRAKEMIGEFMMSHEVGLYNGKQIVSWKYQNGKTSFDATRFKAEHPDLYSEYVKHGNPFRVMR